MQDLVEILRYRALLRACYGAAPPYHESYLSPIFAFDGLNWVVGLQNSHVKALPSLNVDSLVTFELHQIVHLLLLCLVPEPKTTYNVQTTTR
jgi:hypothetical protein